MKVIRIDARRVAEASRLERKQEIERFDLFAIGFALIELPQRLHHRWAADSDPSHCGKSGERQWRSRQTQGFADDVRPELGAPFPVVAFLVCRIEVKA